MLFEKKSITYDIKKAGKKISQFNNHESISLKSFPSGEKEIYSNLSGIQNMLHGLYCICIRTRQGKYG